RCDRHRDLLLGTGRPVPAGGVGRRPRVDGRVLDAVRHARLRRVVLAPLPGREAATGMVRTGWMHRGVWVSALWIRGACGLGEPAAPKGSTPMTPELFIEVYAALREAAAATDDTLVFDSMRNEILRAHGVT